MHLLKGFLQLVIKNQYFAMDIKLSEMYEHSKGIISLTKYTLSLQNFQFLRFPYYHNVFRFFFHQTIFSTYFTYTLTYIHVIIKTSSSPDSCGGFYRHVQAEYRPLVSYQLTQVKNNSLE